MTDIQAIQPSYDYGRASDSWSAHVSHVVPVRNNHMIGLTHDLDSTLEQHIALRIRNNKAIAQFFVRWA